MMRLCFVFLPSSLNINQFVEAAVGQCVGVGLGRAEAFRAPPRLCTTTAKSLRNVEVCRHVTAEEHRSVCAQTHTHTRTHTHALPRCAELLTTERVSIRKCVQEISCSQ